MENQTKKDGYEFYTIYLRVYGKKRKQRKEKSHFIDMSMDVPLDEFENKKEETKNEVKRYCLDYLKEEFLNYKSYEILMNVHHLCTATNITSAKLCDKRNLVLN